MKCLNCQSIGPWNTCLILAFSNSHSFAKIIRALLDRINVEGARDNHPLFSECVPKFDMFGLVAALETQAVTPS